MSMVNAFSREDFERLSESERALIARREKVLGPAYRLFYEKPLHLVRGEGVFLYDGNLFAFAASNSSRRRTAGAATDNDEVIVE